jgi:hypothetical protein
MEKEKSSDTTVTRWRKVKTYDPYLGQEMVRYWGPYKPKRAKQNEKNKQHESD